MFEVAVEAGFSGAHRLRDYEGACERLHGHNYRVKIVVRGGTLNRTGMLIDFKILKEQLGVVMEELDHHCLNDDIPDFGERGLNPTAENIAKWIADRYGKLLPEGVSLAGVTVWESDRSSATYVPD